MSSNLIQMIWDSFLETIIMVAISGGIGALAGIPLGIRYGYQRFMPEVMWTVVIVLIILVQGIQSFGDWIVRRISHK